ncbi:hypothetical protein pb186bvf_002665 [Paramecium bursaria]
MNSACQLKYHTYPYTYICVNLKCREKIKFLCSTRVLEDIHNHDDGPKQNYIIEFNNKQKLQGILKQRFHQIKLEAKERLSNYISIIQQAIQYILKSIQDTQQKYDDLFKNQLKILSNIVNQKDFDVNNILSLLHYERENLLNVNPSQVDFSFMDEIIQIIQQGVQRVNDKYQHIVAKSITNIQANELTNNENYNGKIQNYITYYYVDPKLVNQSIPGVDMYKPKINLKELNQQLNILIDSQYQCKVVHQSKKNFYHAEISPNEQYLVFGGKDSRLYIYDLNNKKLKDEHLDHFISVCRFTVDSKLLFVGCDRGFLYIFKTETNFQQLYVQQFFFKDWVINIHPLSNQEFIISSENSYVVRAYVQNNVEAQKIYCKDQGSIFCLEYNQELDIIIVAGEGKTIIALEGKTGNYLINHPQAHENKISQMQLINNESLITLDQEGKLKWWNIDYTQKFFQEIRNYHDPSNRIYGFYSVFYQEYLILICEKQKRYSQTN